MDPLRLLTRSAKVSKTQRAASARKQQTPSSGPASNPQLFDKDSNRKRKRGSDTPVVASLDFFGGGAATSAHEAGDQRGAEGDRSQTNGAGLQGKDQGGSEDGHDTGGDSDINESRSKGPSMSMSMSADERRQILSRHKVKITHLAGTQQTANDEAKSKSKSKKKSKKENGAATINKPTSHPLYPEPATTFQHLQSRYGLSRSLARNIHDQGYSTTTEVQLGALPLLLGSKEQLGEFGLPTSAPSDVPDAPNSIDLLTVAPTGSGKTLAFMIPLIHALQHIRRQRNQSATEDAAAHFPQAIILAPTRELASQIANEGRKLALNTAVTVTNVRKGMHLGHDPDTATPEEKQVPPVKADILVATPLTMLHAIEHSTSTDKPLSNIRFLVLDEADVLLDPLFRDQTLGVWNALSQPLLRVSFWSATMGSNIEELVKATIRARQERLSESPSATPHDAPLVRLVVGLKDSAVPNIHHQLIYAATEQGKLMALRNLLHPTAANTDNQPILRAPFLVFTQTIERAVALHSELLYDIPSEAGGISRIAVLHSDLSETARDQVMTRFRKGEVWILITTDLLSRGVDFRGVNGVVNYDVPTSAAAYVHRVGRTGRAGREGGVAITYYTDEDVASIKTVANMIAASQKQKSGNESQSVQQWLLDALPTPSKRDKQKLKKRGVEARRSTAAKSSQAGASKTRISTKSGFIRKMENNRRGAIAARHGRPTDGAASDGSFEGFEE